MSCPSPPSNTNAKNVYSICNAAPPGFQARPDPAVSRDCYITAIPGASVLVGGICVHA